MNPIELSEYISVIISLVALTLGSISDLRTREVPDKVWAVYAPIGLGLTIFRLFLDPSLLILTLASVGLSFLIGLGMVFFGLAGGADAKAMMCLGLALPLPPTIMNPALGFRHPFFPIAVLATAYICSLSVAFWMLGRNLVQLTLEHVKLFDGFEKEPRWKKAIALLTGYRTSVERLRQTFYLYPMERVVEDENGARRALELYSSPDVDRDQDVAEFSASLQKVGLPASVWVTPGLPLLLFIFLGMLIVLVLGDPLFGILTLLLSHSVALYPGMVGGFPRQM